MLSQLPVNRRARTWYGQRSAPTEPLSHAQPDVVSPTARIPALRIAQIALQIGKAPLDRRLTGKL